MSDFSTISDGKREGFSKRVELKVFCLRNNEEHHLDSTGVSFLSNPTKNTWSFSGEIFWSGVLSFSASSLKPGGSSHPNSVAPTSVPVLRFKQ